MFKGTKMEMVRYKTQANSDEAEEVKFLCRSQSLAARSKLRTSTGIVDSNLTRTFFSTVLSCVGTGLVMGWSPV
jgi:hypothetical protein